MRRVFTAPWRAVRWFFRAYRRRLSVQLIVSHVLVVLLTALVIELAVAGVFLGAYNAGWLPLSTGIDSFAINTTVMVAQTAGPDAVSAAALGDTERLNSVQQRLALVAGQYDVGSPKRGERRIAITDAGGRIVATSDPTWAPPGQTVDVIPNPLTVRIARRGLELAGAPSGHGNLWVTDGDENETVVVHPILSVDDVFQGLVVLERFDPSSGPTSLPAPTVAAGLVYIIVTTLAVLIAPALVVAVPVGILRARRVSKRVSHLAEAADAMAEGDLGRRVAVKGEDEIARLAERFNEMIASVDRTDRARKAFVANVSHDLRTPVAIVRGHIERLLARRGADPLSGSLGELDDEETRSLAVMHQEALTLERLINDLFTLARIEEAALQIEPAPVAIEEVARAAVEGIRPMAWDQRKVAVEAMLPPDLPPVLADRTRLQQIFGNLLYNALRHTPEGGLIVVGAEQRDGVVEVSVRDTGGGIPEEELEAVFQRHYRLGDGAGFGESSGLGLAIVKQLVEAQDGSICVESVPGEGTVFRFTLPVATKGRG